MKKNRVLAGVMACAMAATLAGCGSSTAADTTPAATSAAAAPAEEAATGDGTITIWAGGSDNVRQIYETLITEFNATHTTQAELQFLMSGTGTQSLTDMLVAAAKAGQTETDYDLVDLGGDDLSKVVAQIGTDYLTKIDKTKIPNAANVSAQSAEAADFVQPYRGTTVILAYNSETVPTPPATMDELVEWIKANPGRFAYNTPGTGGAGDSFVRTAVYNYISDPAATTSNDPVWKEQWDEGFAFLTELHPFLYQSGGTVVYPNKNQGALDLLNQGEIDMCPNWADMVLSQRAAGTISDKIKITTITPSFTGSVQGLAIPTFGSNTEGAYEFIDFMLTEEAQQIMVKQMAAIPLIDTTNMDLTGFEDLQGLDVSNFRTLSIGDLSTDFNERWDAEIGSLG